MRESGSVASAFSANDPPLLLLDKPLRAMLVLPVLREGVVLLLSLLGVALAAFMDDLLRATLICRVTAAAFAALAGLVLLLDVPDELTSIELLLLFELLLMLAILLREARLREWPPAGLEAVEEDMALGAVNMH